MTGIDLGISLTVSGVISFFVALILCLFHVIPRLFRGTTKQRVIAALSVAAAALVIGIMQNFLLPHLSSAGVNQAETLVACGFSALSYFVLVMLMLRSA